MIRHTCFKFIPLLLWLSVAPFQIWSQSPLVSETPLAEPDESLGEAAGLDSLSEDFFSSDAATEDSLNEGGITGDNASAVFVGDAEKKQRYKFWANLVSEFTWLPYFRGDNDAYYINSYGLVETNVSLSLNPWNPLTLFSDVTGRIESPDTIPTQTETIVNVNHLGIRYRIMDQVEMAFGKERHRYAPGLFLSPSEFILADENLPGQRQQRAGAWMTRLSYQTRPLTLDLMFLPFQHTNEFGFPDPNYSLDSKDMGLVGRMIAVVHDMDFGLLGGFYDRTIQLGASFSGYIARGFEIHGEVGYRNEDQLSIQSASKSSQNETLTNWIDNSFHDRNHIFQALLGFRYQPTDKAIFTVEGYFNGNGLSAWELDNLRFLIAPKDWYQHPLLKQVPNFLVDQYLVQIKSNMEQLKRQSSDSFSPFMRWYYLILSAQWTELADIFNVFLVSTISLEDASTLAFARLEWLASSRSIFGVTTRVIFGPDEGQYFSRPADWFFSGEWRINL